VNLRKDHYRVRVPPSGPDLPTLCLLSPQLLRWAGCDQLVVQPPVLWAGELPADGLDIKLFVPKIVV
jgi:hypothetical protein